MVPDLWISANISIGLVLCLMTAVVQVGKMTQDNPQLRQTVQSELCRWENNRGGILLFQSQKTATAVKESYRIRHENDGAAVKVIISQLTQIRTIFFHFTRVAKVTMYEALSAAKAQVTCTAVLCLNASCVNTDSCCCCSAVVLLSLQAACVDIVYIYIYIHTTYLYLDELNLKLKHLHSHWTFTVLCYWCVLCYYCYFRGHEAQRFSWKPKMQQKTFLFHFDSPWASST